MTDKGKDFFFFFFREIVKVNLYSLLQNDQIMREMNNL